MGESTAGAVACGDDGCEPGMGVDGFGDYRINDRVWTMNEIRDHPMFMEDINPGIDISEYPDLMALQSLVYDNQTPEEVAEHFRKLGNEAFRISTNSFANQNALNAYTRGLEMECKDNSLNAQLHSNRAAVSLRLGEYNRAMDDCRAAIRLDPANVKAYFRATKASDALGLTSQALKFCEAGLQVSPAEKEMQQLQKRLAQACQREEADRQRDQRAAEKAAKERGFADVSVEQALGERGITLGPLLFDVSMYAQGVPLKPKLTDDGEAVQWPLLLLYDETNQSDFVETFDERCTLDEQLQLMFPQDRRVNWDDEGKYVWDRLVAYMEFYPDGASTTEMLPVATGNPLHEMLSEHCLPPCIGLHILVRSTPAHDHFCKAHGLPST